MSNSCVLHIYCSPPFFRGSGFYPAKSVEETRIPDEVSWLGTICVGQSQKTGNVAGVSCMSRECCRTFIAVLLPCEVSRKQETLMKSRDKWRHEWGRAMRRRSWEDQKCGGSKSYVPRDCCTMWFYYPAKCQANKIPDEVSWPVTHVGRSQVTAKSEERKCGGSKSIISHLMQVLLSCEKCRGNKIPWWSIGWTIRTFFYMSFFNLTMCHVSLVTIRAGRSQVTPKSEDRNCGGSELYVPKDCCTFNAVLLPRCWGNQVPRWSLVNSGDTRQDKLLILPARIAEI